MMAINKLKNLHADYRVLKSELAKLEGLTLSSENDGRRFADQHRDLLIKMNNNLLAQIDLLWGKLDYAHFDVDDFAEGDAAGSIENESIENLISNVTALHEK